MPHKGRLTLAERIKAVEDCKSGRDSATGRAKKLGIHIETLRCWIRLYEARGVEGLMPSSTKRKYPVEIKVLAVEDFISGRRSLMEICTKYDISRHSMVQNWVKRYNSHGEFKQQSSEGAIYMAKGRKTTLAERIEIVSYCIASNKDYGKAIERYGVSYQQIYGWVRRYEERGSDGLVDRRGKRKDEALMTEVEKLRAQLKLKEAENLRLQMENELLKKLETLERGRGID